MPKQTFWPAAIIALGLIYLASAMGYLPAEYHFLWPIIMIVVGLGGLLTSDRKEWLVDPTKIKSAPARSTVKAKKTVARRR